MAKKPVEETPGARRTWWVVGLAVLVVLAAAVPLAVALRDSSSEKATPAPALEFEPPPPPPEQTKAPVHRATGKELFLENCGGCHTLAAAGTEGAGGPNLDKLRPGRKRVLAAIERGGSGDGVMPPKLVEGKEAERVARFVAASAGR